MARKGIFATSLERTLSSDVGKEQTAPPAPTSGGQESGSPTVRRFRETYDDLLSQSIQDVDTALIGKSPYQDRFDATSEIDTLVASIKESGQQVPVLLRNAPPGSDHEYEPVYGRRRIAACRELGIKVKAHISDLDDEAMVIAQGLENAERLENSFIERTAFVTQLMGGGMKGVIIERALRIPAAEISRMAKVMRDVPEDLVDAIGPARGIGRRQWLELAALTAASDRRRIDGALETMPSDQGSPERFKHVMERMKHGGVKKTAAPKARKVVAADGSLVMTIKDKDVTFKVADSADAQFLAWLEDQGEKLFVQWKSEKA